MKYIYTSLLLTLLHFNSIFSQSFIKDGYVTDALTKLPAKGIIVTMPVFDNSTEIDTLGPLTTNEQGYYSTQITDIEDDLNTNSQAVLQYKGNKIITGDISEKTLIIYNVLGEQVRFLRTYNSEINLDFNGLVSGRYLSILKIKDNLYSNLYSVIDGEIIGQKKLKETISTIKLNDIYKTSENLILTRDFEDTTGSYLSYNRGVIDESYYDNTTFNLTLPPVISLQYPFTDSEVSYPINNLMDLWKYMSRVQDQTDNRVYAKTLWPIKIFIDSANAPADWLPYIKNAVSIVRDSLGIEPDSILQLNEQYTEPDYNLGYSAMDVIYMDSTEYKNLFGSNGYAGGGFFFDNTYETAIGYYLFLNKDKLTNPMDAQKYALKAIQKYITQSTYPINDPHYIGQTDNTQGPGTATTYNEGERTLMRMVRNMSPNVWINRFFNPGQLSKVSRFVNINVKENIIERFSQDKSIKVIVK